MAAGFLRRYKISVKSPVIDGNIFRGSLEDNQIKAHIAYNSTGTQSSGDNHTIQIYNPDQDTIVALREKGAMVELQAGYQYEDGIETLPEDLPLIFRGEVTESTVVRTSSDTVLTIELTQGFTQMRTTKISESFQAGEKLSNVLEIIVSRLLVSGGFNRGTALEGDALVEEQLGGIDSAGSSRGVQITGSESGAVVALGSRQNDTLLFDRTYAGTVVDVLEEICRTYGFRWYYFLDTVYVTWSDEDWAARQGEPTITNVHNRIKGDINWTVEDSTTPNKPQEVKVSMTLFLYPTIALGSVISLTLEDADVTLTVVSIVHSLDYYGDAWETSIVAINKEVT